MSDQGYSYLAQGCTQCAVWMKDKRVRAALVIRGKFWCCPVCGGSYGEVEPASISTPVAALAEHRLHMKKPLGEPGRETTFFLFTTYGGDRVGLDPETLTRMLVLFPVWDGAKAALGALGPSASSRLSEVELSSTEVVLDEASGRIYSTRLQIQFGNGIVLRKRDAETGRAGGRDVDSHEIDRHSLEAWQSADRVIVDRSVASGRDPATGRYEDVDRKPSPDELAGIVWWNAQSERARALWLERVGTGIVADVWELLKSNPGAALEIGLQEGHEIASARGARIGGQP
jgi:hypothetical protein